MALDKRQIFAAARRDKDAHPNEYTAEAREESERLTREEMARWLFSGPERFAARRREAITRLTGRPDASQRRVEMELARLTNGGWIVGFSGRDDDLGEWLNTILDALDMRDAEQNRAGPAKTTAKRPMRKTERAVARDKLIAALTKHHQYADGSCVNQEPVGNNELAKAADVSASTASAFFNDKFQGHTKYKGLCRDAGKLAAALRLLNDEFAPYHLLGDAASDLAAPEQDDADSE